jgi:hypothetical protein
LIANTSPRAAGHFTCFLWPRRPNYSVKGSAGCAWRKSERFAANGLPTPSGSMRLPPRLAHGSFMADVISERLGAHRIGDAHWYILRCCYECVVVADEGSAEQRIPL